MSIASVVTLLSDIETPVSLFDKVSRNQPLAFLFESADGDSRLARYSILGVDPVKTVSFSNGLATVEDRLEKQTSVTRIDNPLHFLRDFLRQEAPRFQQSDHPDFPFTGGLVGYLGYAATRYFDRIQPQEQDPFGIPEGFYGLYDTVVLFDHLYRKIHIFSHRGDEQTRQVMEQIYHPVTLKSLFDSPAASSENDFYADLKTVFTKEEFCEVVRRCKEFITAGEVFQIVPSQRFSLPVHIDTLDIYRTLVSLNPSPYAYFLKFPDFTYLGSSPETFVQCRNGQAVLRALAGTRPRGATPEEDERLAAELQSNEKELAEHYMLIDLERNDLGRVCRVGSIEVGEIATLLRYRHVMHLATEVRGTLRPEKTIYDVFQSCFPRGTVSGAPKIRAMQLLAQLEPERRGVYSGVVGYIDADGNMDGAIAIRSALIKNGMAHVNAGAGIVYDSDPEAEYEETRNKAKSILRAVQLAKTRSHVHFTHR